MNRRHMTDDHHGRTAGRATLLVRAVDEILGTHSHREEAVPPHPPEPGHDNCGELAAIGFHEAGQGPDRADVQDSPSAAGSPSLVFPTTFRQVKPSMAAAVLGLGAGDMSAGYVRPVAATDPVPHQRIRMDAGRLRKWLTEQLVSALLPGDPGRPAWRPRTA